MSWYWWVLVGVYAAAMATTFVAGLAAYVYNSMLGGRPTWTEWLWLCVCAAFWPLTCGVWLRRMLDDGE